MTDKSSNLLKSSRTHVRNAPKPTPTPTVVEIKQLSLVADTISDLVGSFMSYDRQEDEELPVGVIENLMEKGLLTEDAIVDSFSESLSSYLANNLGEPTE